MSTVKTSNLQNGSSSSVNIALNTDGSATFAQMPVGPSYFAMRNKIINGAMEIDQRNSGASVTIGAGAPTYTLDRFAGFASQASKFSIQQNAASVAPPAGFSSYLGVTSLSSYSVGASERFAILQKIEGYNIIDLAWGTASAKTITVSFWVQSSLTGTFGGALRNSAGNRSYPFSYSISNANTWEFKTITIAGSTSGAFGSTNNEGVQIWFSIGTGTTYSGAAGSWANTDYSAATGGVSVVGTNGATWYLTGVQFEVGSVATPFERRIYSQELAMCQRYYFTIDSTNLIFRGFNYGASAYAVYISYNLPVNMRTTPTISNAQGDINDGSVKNFDFATAFNAQSAFFRMDSVPTLQYADLQRFNASAEL